MFLNLLQRLKAKLGKMTYLSRAVNNMEVKKLSPNAYRLHDLLKEMCLGEQNAFSADQIVQWLGLESTRELRKLRAEINSNTSELHKKCLTSSKGYFIASADNPHEAHKQYKKVAWRKIKAGLSMLNEGKQLLEQLGLDEQTRLNLTGSMKEIVEIYNKEHGNESK